jgi:hypothetical protein
MATCRYCGKWSGLFSSEHFDCAMANAKGEKIVDPIEPSRPLTAVGVYWAVFFALLTFSLLSGVVLFFIRLTSTP